MATTCILAISRLSAEGGATRPNTLHVVKPNLKINIIKQNCFMKHFKRHMLFNEISTGTHAFRSRWQHRPKQMWML